MSFHESRNVTDSVFLIEPSAFLGNQPAPSVAGISYSEKLSNDNRDPYLPLDRLEANAQDTVCM